VIKDFIRRDVVGTWRMTGMVKLPLDMDANNIDFVFAIGDYAMQTTDAFWMGSANASLHYDFALAVISYCAMD
jgi:hypothetical protein